MGRTLQFPKGSIAAIDRGNNGYPWYNQLTEQGILFATRFKSNANCRFVSLRSIAKEKGLTRDQTTEFTSTQTTKQGLIQLRRIGCRDSKTGNHYVFLTDQFKLSAKTIVDTYQALWQVDFTNTPVQMVLF